MNIVFGAGNSGLEWRLAVKRASSEVMKEACEAKGASPGTFAAAIGRSRSVFAERASGDRSWPFEDFLGVAEAAGYDPAELVARVMERVPPFMARTPSDSVTSSGGGL